MISILLNLEKKCKLTKTVLFRRIFIHVHISVKPIVICTQFSIAVYLVPGDHLGSAMALNEMLRRPLDNVSGTPPPVVD